MLVEIFIINEINFELASFSVHEWFLQTILCSYYSLYNVERDSLSLLYIPLPAFLQILLSREGIFGSNYTKILEATTSSHPDCVSEGLIQDWESLCVSWNHAGYVVVKQFGRRSATGYRQRGLFPKTSQTAVPNNGHSAPPFSISNV